MPGAPQHALTPSFACIQRSAFGILEWGACGYTNSDGEVQVAKEEASAYSDDNPDYAGSCGRCYE
eukprot:scaffold298531_cov21-Tisochrysis_lutea.AAC.2